MSLSLAIFLTVYILFLTSLVVAGLIVGEWWSNRD